MCSCIISVISLRLLLPRLCITCVFSILFFVMFWQRCSSASAIYLSKSNWTFSRTYINMQHRLTVSEQECASLFVGENISPKQIWTFPLCIDINFLSFELHTTYASKNIQIKLKLKDVSLYLECKLCAPCEIFGNYTWSLDMLLTPKASYLKMERLHPLSYHLILWNGGVGHLELEQVISSWSVTIFVKHNRGARTACRVWEGIWRNTETCHTRVLRGWSSNNREKHEPLTHFLLLWGGLHIAQCESHQTLTYLEPLC